MLGGKYVLGVLCGFLLVSLTETGLWTVVQTTLLGLILSFCRAWLNFSVSPTSKITLGLHALCLWYICSCRDIVRQECLGICVLIKKEVTEDVSLSGG